MPASRLLRFRSLPAVLLAVQASVWTLAARAGAAPATPTPSATGTATPSATSDPCRLISGPAKDYCQHGTTSQTPKSTDPAGTLDPLTSLAKGCAEAASWTIDKLAAAITKTTEVDFTNTSFLRQYAVVFAASTILTLILWLLAVAKRAVRGVPMTEALTEAVGFLWLTVLASAFTPLVLYTVVSATDAVTDVISSGTQTNTDVFFGSFSDALKKGTDIGGGPIMLIVVSMVSVLAAGVLWLELVMRAALLYVGALLGTAVYAGLVDKNMWHHVRRWAGIMIAVILVKPVIVIVLGLAGALSSANGPDSFSAVVSGLAIILLAIFASAMIYRFVPGFGDDVVNLRNNRKQSGQSPTAAVISSPAALVRQGITTHSARGGPQEQAQGGGAGAGNPVAGGMAAHSSRGSGPGGAGTSSGAGPSGSPVSGSPYGSAPGRGPGPGSNSSTSGGDRR